MDREKKRFPTGLVLFVGLLVLPVLYILSMGPIALFVNKPGFPAWGRALVNIYTFPATLLTKVIPGFYEFVSAYIDLWR